MKPLDTDGKVLLGSWIVDVPVKLTGRGSIISQVVDANSKSFILGSLSRSTGLELEQDIIIFFDFRFYAVVFPTFPLFLSKEKNRQ